MNDPKVIIAGIVALVVIVLIFVLRNRMTGFRGGVSGKGVDVDFRAAHPDRPATGEVDISEATFKDDNEFAADNDALIKARKLQAGSGNKFVFGTTPKPADESEPKP